MRVADFNYELPPELIAQEPLAERAASRMLVMARPTGRCELRTFRDFPELLRAGDCVVLNDTKVIPARLLGHRASGGRVEFLLVEELRPGVWRSLARPGGKLRIGERVQVDGGGRSVHGTTEGETPTEERKQEGKANGASFRFSVGAPPSVVHPSVGASPSVVHPSVGAPPSVFLTVVGREPEEGLVLVDFGDADVLALLERVGRIPLPPYIEREARAEDRHGYQTVYARQPGAVAAPTAGLHFTPEILAACEAKGVKLAQVTLHVGPGTFRPVKAERVEEHVMHAEAYELTAAAAAIINATRRAGGRVIAIGTTSVRVLESCADPATRTVIPGAGRTRIFLHPPQTPLVTDALLTNFHLPQSTLLMLVSCFSSVEHVQAAYALAIRERFRFFSYGDCMLLLP